jgi:hypothetical protein
LPMFVRPNGEATKFMSRPRKMHKPLKGTFNEILAAVTMGTGKGKKAAKELAQQAIVKASQPKASPPASKK